MSETVYVRGRRLIRFIVSGGSAAALFFVLSYAGLKAGLQPFFSTISAYSIAFAAGYFLQRVWTFEARHAHRNALPRYAALQVACALGSGALAHVAIALGSTPLIASGCTTLAAGSVSYVVSSLWVFPDEKHDTERAI